MINKMLYNYYTEEENKFAERCGGKKGSSYMGNDRRKRLLEVLNARAFISLHEMEEMFPNVSSMTLRRDIDYFERNGEAIKVRGGMKSVRLLIESSDPPYSTRLHTAYDRKTLIARTAISELCVGDSIFLDSGTTATCFAAHIPDEHLNVATTGLSVAQELMKKNLINVHILGGLVMRNSNSTAAASTIKCFEGYAPDVAFIIPSGMSMDGVITSGNMAEAEQRSMMVQRAKKTVLMIDSTKFGRTLPCHTGKLEDFDVIVTDRPLPSPLDKIAEKAGVKVVIA